MLAKIDLKKELKEFYHASPHKVTVVDVPAFTYLMIDGAGDPNASPAYAQAVETLFAASYTAKFMVKRSDGGIDYTVMPLEGLWWADDWSAFETGDRARWQWTMMILQPDFVPATVLVQALERVRRDKPHLPVDQVRLERWAEGRAAQILHIGPFSEEGPTLQRLHAFIREHGQLRGKHHEIDLSDIRRAAPKRWRTILRQPMKQG